MPPPAPTQRTPFGDVDAALAKLRHWLADPSASCDTDEVAPATSTINAAITYLTSLSASLSNPVTPVDVVTGPDGEVIVILGEGRGHTHYQFLPSGELITTRFSNNTLVFYSRT